MKKVLFIFFIAFVSVDSYCDNLGLGIVIGKPSGINFSNSFNNEEFYLTMNWKSSGDGYIALGLDKVYLLKKYYEKEGYEPEPYFVYHGFGLGFKFDNGSDVYLRIPLGIKKEFNRFNFFIQLTPKLKVTDEVKGDVDLFLGTRYYFK